MNTKLKIALGLAFVAFGFTANAQKNYTQGLATYSVATAMGTGESKVYFTTDSSAMISQMGPANIKFLSNIKSTYFAVTVDVPVAGMKKAAVATPDEVDQAISEMPKYTFKPGTETKVINGFNTKKVDVTDSKSGSTFTAWVTKDFTMPLGGMAKAFADAGGVPVQFTVTQQGQKLEYTLKSITDTKAPAGTFVIGPGYERITMDELKSMGGRR